MANEPRPEKRSTEAEALPENVFQPAPDASSQVAAEPAHYSLLGVDVEVLTLSNGRRAVELGSMAALLMMAFDVAPDDDQSEVAAFGRWVRSLPPPAEEV